MTSSYANYIIYYAMNKEDADLLFLIKVLDKKVCEDFDNRLSKFGLTGQQGRILFFINYKKETANSVLQCDIEKRYNLSKSTVSGLVQRLIKNEFVIRTKKGLEPTEKALKVISALKEGREQTLNRLTQGFDENEKKQLIEGFKQLIENMGGYSCERKN